MNKPTPEWHLDDEGQTIRGPHDISVGWFGEATMSAGAGFYNIGTTEAKANARLACAAPDLLDQVLEVEWIFSAVIMAMICPWCEQTKEHGHSIDCPRQAALRKAGVIE